MVNYSGYDSGWLLVVDYDCDCLYNDGMVILVQNSCACKEQLVECVRSSPNDWCQAGSEVAGWRLVYPGNSWFVMGHHLRLPTNHWVDPLNQPDFAPYSWYFSWIYPDCGWSLLLRYRMELTIHSTVVLTIIDQLVTLVMFILHRSQSSPLMLFGRSGLIHQVLDGFRHFPHGAVHQTCTPPIWWFIDHT